MAIVYHQNGVVLWHVTESVDELLSRVVLTQQQHNHLAGFRCQSQAGLWLSARVISQELFGSTILYRESGAPYLAQSPLCISISHTCDILAFAYSDTAVGVDVEHRDRNAARILRKFGLPQEVDMARELYPSNPELLLWCAKEALYKVHGREAIEFKTQIRINDTHDQMLGCMVEQQNYSCQLLQYQDYLITKAF